MSRTTWDVTWADVKYEDVENMAELYKEAAKLLDDGWEPFSCVYVSREGVGLAPAPRMVMWFRRESKTGSTSNSRRED